MVRLLNAPFRWCKLFSLFLERPVINRTHSVSEIRNCKSPRITLTHIFKFYSVIGMIVYWMVSVGANDLAHTGCQRYDKNSELYQKIQNPKYVFYDGVTTCHTLGAFLDKLKNEVKKDNVDKIAQLIHYPCRFNSKIAITIQNKNQFKKLYRHIFTKAIKKAAIDGKVDEGGYRGFMINNGVIWFFPNIGIIAFNP